MTRVRLLSAEREREVACEERQEHIPPPPFLARFASQTEDAKGQQWGDDIIDPVPAYKYGRAEWELDIGIEIGHVNDRIGNYCRREQGDEEACDEERRPTREPKL